MLIDVHTPTLLFTMYFKQKPEKSNYQIKSVLDTTNREPVRPRVHVPGRIATVKV